MKRKNKKVLKAVKILAVVYLAISLSVFAVGGKSKENTPRENTTTEYEYKLAEFDGRIAVFDLETNSPIEVFDVYVSSLPYSEQSLIRQGLFASDRAELQRLIEDYTS